MNDPNKLPFRPRDALPFFNATNKLAISQPPRSSNASRTLTNPKPPKLRAQILAKLSLVHPAMKPTILTSKTNGEYYAHVIDENEKVKYSSIAQESIKAALEVLLALVEEDNLGSIGLEDMNIEAGDEEQEVDHEMEAD